MAIEALPTHTTAFLGETERGPDGPQLVLSYAEYERSFGGVFGQNQFMPHAVSGFFGNGGKRAVICRTIDGNPARALDALEGEAWRDVSLVYAPNAAVDVARALVSHCEKLRHRFAVIDCEPRRENALDLNPQTAVAASSRAAFYYPWLYTSAPGTGARTLTPPGGHVLGVYARTDLERGVFKAPANELVRGALDVEFAVTTGVQNQLPLKGVNVIRSFPGRGIRVWGARTLAPDSEWKYVNVRRLLIFLEQSIEEGLKWAVFEPNDANLWMRVVQDVANFLRVQWRAGALPGRVEKEAFFVKCDQSTMTQSDIASGRLICQVGVAVFRPSEFIVFRISQRTA